MTSIVSTTVPAIQSKYDDNILSLHELIERFLLLKDSPSAIPPSDLDTAAKAFFSANILLIASTKKWNQANLGYFDPHLNKAHGEGKIVLLGKDVYYRNIVLFMQHFQSFVTFWGVALVKVNIVTLLQCSALEWYTSKLRDFNCNMLNNNSGIKS